MIFDELSVRFLYNWTNWNICSILNFFVLKDLYIIICLVSVVIVERRVCNFVICWVPAVTGCFQAQQFWPGSSSVDTPQSRPASFHLVYITLARRFNIPILWPRCLDKFSSKSLRRMHLLPPSPRNNLGITPLRKQKWRKVCKKWHTLLFLLQLRTKLLLHEY